LEEIEVKMKNAIIRQDVNSPVNSGNVFFIVAFVEIINPSPLISGKINAIFYIDLHCKLRIMIQLIQII